MPKGKSPARQKQPPDAPSHPVLRNPDNHPPGRRQANDAAIRRRPSEAVAFHRPGTSNGRLQRKRGPAPGADLKAAAQSAVPSSTNPGGYLNVNTIGIALGSPRLVESQMISHVREGSGGSATNSKPYPPEAKSKWRKIGSLFKAKRALTSPPKQSFYQVHGDSDWPLQDSTHSDDLWHQEDHATQTRDPEQYNDEWPRPCLNSDPAPDDTVHNTMTKAKQDASNALLQVEIPDIELERYSVMFGALLGTKSPSARSSRTTPSLKLDLPNPPRPAASPRLKSPSFTLFPATHTSKSKALAVLGTNNLPPGSPLIQSMTMDQIKRREHKKQTSGASSSVSSSMSPEPRSDSATSIEQDQGAQLPGHSTADKQRNKTTAVGRTTPPTLRINTNVQSSPPNSDRSTAFSASNTHATKSAGRNAPRANHEPPPGGSFYLNLDDSDNSMGPKHEEKKDIPKIEVSVARSVSVSKGKGHAIVAVGRRAGAPDPDGRLVDRRAKAPHLINGEVAHRHGKSQIVRIETV